MNDEQLDRPPWLRNLRPRHEVEAEAYAYAPFPRLDEPVMEPDLGEVGFESSPGDRSWLSRPHVLLFLLFLLWMNIIVLGCLCLMGTQRIIP